MNFFWTNCFLLDLALCYSSLPSWQCCICVASVVSWITRNNIAPSNRLRLLDDYMEDPVGLISFSIFWFGFKIPVHCMMTWWGSCGYRLKHQLQNWTEKKSHVPCWIVISSFPFSFGRISIAKTIHLLQGTWQRQPDQTTYDPLPQLPVYEKRELPPRVTYLYFLHFKCMGMYDFR